MTQGSSEDQGQEELARLYTLLAYVFRGGLAATLASVLFLGIGSRVVMRISALLNTDSRGLITENENVVGRITAGGTAELIVFVGILGGFFSGTVWVLVREWMPEATLPRVALAGVLAVLTGGFQVINSHNSDFVLLDPPALHIAMFALLVALTGATMALFDRFLEPHVPTTGTPASILGGLAGFGLIFALPLLVISFFSDQDQNPPAAAGLALIAVTAATITTWVRFYSSGEMGFSARPVWLQRFGVVAVTLLGIAGGIHLLGEITAIA